MWRHCWLAALASSWAKAVAMKAEMTRRPCLPAWARAFLMKWTRQRCQEVLSTFETAALMPSWLSEMTSFTPRRPRRASLRRSQSQALSIVRRIRREAYLGRRRMPDPTPRELRAGTDHMKVRGHTSAMPARASFIDALDYFPTPP
jgi:hypothetical protein